MATELEDIKALQIAEKIADELWELVVEWNYFERDVVGKQLARSADSIGANIAEAYGRFHYGEKIRFLYYARGSIFETKYWITRSLSCDLISEGAVSDYGTRLSNLAKKINAFIGNLKRRQHGEAGDKKAIKEYSNGYEGNGQTLD
jgi:four helix bundle protein